MRIIGDIETWDPVPENDLKDVITHRINSHIHIVNDFPKEGIVFRDISPLLANPDLMYEACRAMVNGIDLSLIDAVVGIESRGFIFATQLSHMYHIPLVLIRKKGKLPPPVISYDYALEYGTDRIEMKKSDAENKNVIVVDDVLATGGTLQAAFHLCHLAGYKVKAISILLDIAHLHSEDLFSVPCISTLRIDQ